jgi:hypothetical protein
MAINRERRKQGLPTVQRNQRKTTRKYVFSGRFAGQNGGKRRVFRSKTLNRVMDSAPSAFVDADGESVMPKRVAYQGKYAEWWSRVHGEKRKGKKIRATGKEIQAIRATGKKNSCDVAKAVWTSTPSSAISHTANPSQQKVTRRHHSMTV